MSKQLIFFIFFILLSFSIFAQEKIALVIGNNTYQNNQALRNSFNDATDIAHTLEILGFKVILKLNVNQEEMDTAIRKFGKKLKMMGGVGLFYYSGHGVQYENSNYLIPIGAISHISTPKKLLYKTINIKDVFNEMEWAGNRLNIIILDACRNNPFKNFSRTKGITRQGLKEVSGVEGMLIAYSTLPEKIALDGTGRNSPYTQQLLHFMTSPNLPVEIMFKRVREKVNFITKGKQLPWYKTSIGGDILTRISPYRLIIKENEEEIYMDDTIPSYYPNYNPTSSIIKCDLILFSLEKNTICNSNYIKILGIDFLKRRFLARNITFSPNKFKTAIIKSKLPKIVKSIKKFKFNELLAHYIPKKLDINKLSNIQISQVEETDGLIIFDEDNYFKGIINFQDLRNKDIFKATTILTQQLINLYLTPEIPPDIKESILKKIPLPLLPSPQKIIKNEFETKKMFYARVNKRVQERLTEIKTLQYNFRKEVEERNKKVLEIQKNMNAINSKYNLKKEKLNQYIQYFTSLSFKYLAGNLSLNNLKYDAEKAQMYADLSSENNNFSKKIALNIPINKAKKFKENNQLKPIVTYQYNNNKLILKDIQVEDYHAALTQVDFNPEVIEIK